MKTQQHNPFEYIQIPRKTKSTMVRIDAILEARMKEFLLSRRRIEWQKYGR